ncbi:hypothetical protein PYCC9005_001444 [Savitreella phatthalungensis]
MGTSFADLLPFVRYPILSGPMANVAGADLAIAVSRAGGLGFIGAGYKIEAVRGELERVRGARDEDKARGVAAWKVGLGIITFAVPKTAHADLFAMIREYADELACFWLFGGEETDYWLPTFLKTFPEKRLPILVQCFSLAEARQCVAAGADIIVAQGSDAGGHGGAKCASIVGLVPEFVSDSQVGGKVPVLAAGGLVDGRGLAAARALGAQGAVFGTLFMLTTESKLHEAAKQLACSVSDGGLTTVQTRIYDEMRGTTDWPMTFTGRAIINDTHRDSVSGSSEHQLRDLYRKAISSEDYSRLVCWAGTGIGLVNDVRPAAERVSTLVEQYRVAVSSMPPDL